MIEGHDHVGEVRRFSQDAARDLGFDETLTGKISIVVTELATNIVKHAGCPGEILLIEGEKTLHILALDRGQGIKNIDRSMADGVSTGGTAGTGLGAIKRGASLYDIYTSEGDGTVIYAGFTDGKKTLPFGAICTPYKGEEVAGDTWAFKEVDSKLKFILADGLGHGLLASEASRLACEIYKEEAMEQERMMQTLHLALRSTRGAAVSLADIDLRARTISFCGVGNVQGSIKGIGSAGKKCINYNGTIGVQIRKIQSMTYPYEKGDVFVLASDGLSTHWNLMDYPGILHRHPFVIAGVLYRDFFKNTDDVTVIVVREET